LLPGNHSRASRKAEDDFTEGETGELDEHILDRGIAPAGGVEQVTAANRRSKVGRAGLAELLFSVLNWKSA